MKPTPNRYTIGALGRATGCKPVTIRYYEKQGLLSPPARTEGGYRLYSESDRARLIFIRRSRQLGFSLEDIRELLGLSDQREASCAAVDAKVAKHLAEVRQRIEDLRALEAEMQRLLKSCRGGRIAECRIIEALSAKSR